MGTAFAHWPPMNSRRPKTAFALMKLEDARASEGVFVGADQSIEKEVHESQVVKWDTRRALAVSSLHKEEAPISFIRSLIQRGNLEAAKVAALELRGKIQEGDTHTLPLLAFEEVRIAIFESRWEEVTQKVSEALKLAVPPVTQLALFQMRASAYLELGNFAQASIDLEEAEQLSTLFPFATSVLYVRTLKVRVLARIRGVPQAQDLLNSIIKERIDSGKLDLDLLLTYLRVQIDLNRLSQRPFWKESIACFMLADAIGDKLYSALAEVDYISSQTSSLEEFLKKTESLGKSFLKISKIQEELSGKSAQSTSCLIILESLRENLGTDGKSSLSQLLSEGSFNQALLLLNDLGIVADLEKRQILAVPPQGQTSKALEAVSEKALSKKEFFAAIWGRQAYSPRLHDTLISSLIHRLKKDCGVIAHVEDGCIRVQKTLLVL